jgi:hypothetical protein
MHLGLFNGKTLNSLRRLRPIDPDYYLAAYIEYVKLYSSRNLTFQSDALKAFTGIMRHLENSKFSILQIWATPFPHPKHIEDKATSLKYLTAALMWQHGYKELH